MRLDWNACLPSRGSGAQNKVVVFMYQDTDHLIASSRHGSGTAYCLILIVSSKERTGLLLLIESLRRDEWKRAETVKIWEAEF